MPKKVNIAIAPRQQKGNDYRQQQAEDWIAGAAQGKMKRFTIDMPIEIHRRIKTGCSQRDLKMADWVRQTLERHLPELENRN